MPRDTVRIPNRMESSREQIFSVARFAVVLYLHLEENAVHLAQVRKDVNCFVIREVVYFICQNINSF